MFWNKMIKVFVSLEDICKFKGKNPSLGEK